MDIKQISNLAEDIDTFQEIWTEETITTPATTKTVGRKPVGVKEFIQSKLGTVFTELEVVPEVVKVIRTERNTHKYNLVKSLYNATYDGKTMAFLMRQRSEDTALWQSITNVFN